jgi:hemerythrin superfamily protein
MYSAGSTIYDLLKADHAMVMSALDSLEKITDAVRRKDVFSFIRTELVMHSKAEEEVFYQPLREVANHDMLLVESSFDDHHDIEHLLMEIQMTSALNESWIEKVRELRGIILHHVTKEETDMFNLAQEYFSVEEEEDMAIRMMEEKGKLGMENPFTVAARKMKDLMTGS